MPFLSIHPGTLDQAEHWVSPNGGLKSKKKKQTAGRGADRTPFQKKKKKKKKNFFFFFLNYLFPFSPHRPKNHKKPAVRAKIRLFKNPTLRCQNTSKFELRGSGKNRGGVGVVMHSNEPTTLKKIDFGLYPCSHFIHLYPKQRICQPPLIPCLVCLADTQCSVCKFAQL